jgi:ligand-binding sensor domain-containing protein
LAGDDINSIRQDPSDRIWIASETGLSCLDGDTISCFTTDGGGLPSNIVHAVDVDGVVWAGTSEGLWRWQDGDVRVFTEADGLASHQVLRVLVDRTGNLWLGTWGGVNRFDGQVFQTLTSEDGLATHMAMALYGDPDGTIWFGTSGGLTVFQPPPPMGHRRSGR